MPTDCHSIPIELHSTVLVIRWIRSRLRIFCNPGIAGYLQGNPSAALNKRRGRVRAPRSQPTGCVTEPPNGTHGLAISARTRPFSSRPVRHTQDRCLKP